MTARLARLILVGGCSVSALVTAGSAAAQDAAAVQSAAGATQTASPADNRPQGSRAVDRGQQQDIIVTANKRRERLLDVAGSVSAVQGEDLQQRQALDLQDIAKSVAGLNLQQGGTPGITRIILRGQNSGGDSATVASVVDDAPLSFSAANTNGGLIASDFDTYDMQRVEVLRGPQGTLYGATAEGGLIRYVTNQADPAGFRFGAEAGASTVAHGDAAGQGKAYVNVPLADNAAVRATGFYVGLPGWGRNPLIGAKDINDGERWGVRGNLYWEPTQGLVIRGLALYQHGKFNGNGSVQVNGIANPANPFGLVDGYSYNSYIKPFSKSDYQLYSLNISDDIGFATISSITSYGKIKVDSVNDLIAYANLLAPSTVVPAQTLVSNEKISQELRLASKPDSSLFGARFDWQGGLFYTRERVRLAQNYDLQSYPARTSLGALVTSAVPSRYQDFAGYLDATLHFSPSFDVEAGVRVSHNKQRNQTTTGGLLAGGVTTTFPEVRQSETAVTYQVAPRFHFTPDMMLYARVASGYRPGGPALPVPGGPASLPTSFRHDRTVNYEIGVKGQLFDRKVTVDVAAFYIDWTDIQIISNVVVNGTQFNFTGNAGKAVSKGVEWNLAWTVAPGLTLGDLGAYTDAHLTRDAPAIGGNNGDDLPYVANINNTVRVDYEQSLSGDWAGFVGGSWSYFGHRYSDFPQHVKLPTYSSFDAQLGVRNGRYTVELYAKNVSDQRGITSYVPFTAFNNTGYAGIIRPRTIGIRVAADF